MTERSGGMDVALDPPVGLSQQEVELAATLRSIKIRALKAAADVCSDVAADARGKRQRGAELGALRCAHELRIMAMSLDEPNDLLSRVPAERGDGNGG